MSEIDAANPIPEPSWSVLRGWIDRPDRPAAWREAALWALGVLESELGARWPERTWAKFGRLTGPVAMSGAYVFAYVELLELALRLQLLHDALGRDRLTKLMKRTVAAMDMAHLRVQLEVAGFAARAGVGVTFEPQVSGSRRRGDLLIDFGSESVLIECAAMGRADTAVEDDGWMQRVANDLRLLNVNPGVGITATFTERLDDDATVALLEHVRRASAFVAAGGTAPAHRVEGAVVELHADRDRYEISGPPQKTDHGKKLQRLVRAKGGQTSGELPAWICIHSLDALFWGDEWNATPLPRKLDAFADLFAQALTDYPHVAGVVISNGLSLVDSRRDNEQANLSSGAYAVRQPVPPIRHREAYVVPVGEAPTTAGVDFFATSYESEPDWLPWALSANGLPTPVAIFAASASEQSVSDQTPD